MIGLCAKYGWLPSAALDEDWALLAELQARVVADNAQDEHDAWQAKVKSGWQTKAH